MGLIVALAIGGIILILAEVFVPGGILGGMGFICIGFSIYFAYKDYGITGLLISGVVSVTAGVLTWILAFKLLPKMSGGNELLLTKTQKGYDTRVNELSKLIGKTGEASSALHPTGKVDVEGQKYDAVSEGDFLSAGSKIIVTGVRSNQLVVTSISSEKEI
jgi:membrane-bound serine protease (ClpP class)